MQFLILHFDIVCLVDLIFPAMNLFHLLSQQFHMILQKNATQVDILQNKTEIVKSTSKKIEMAYFIAVIIILVYVKFLFLILSNISSYSQFVSLSIHCNYVKIGKINHHNLPILPLTTTPSINITEFTNQHFVLEKFKDFLFDTTIFNVFIFLASPFFYIYIIIFKGHFNSKLGGLGRIRLRGEKEAQTILSKNLILCYHLLKIIIK